jgi:hypothetical protein
MVIFGRRNLFNFRGGSFNISVLVLSNLLLLWNVLKLFNFKFLMENFGLLLKKRKRGKEEKRRSGTQVGTGLV